MNGTADINPKEKRILTGRLSTILLEVCSIAAVNYTTGTGAAAAGIAEMRSRSTI